MLSGPMPSGLSIRASPVCVSGKPPLPISAHGRPSIATSALTRSADASSGASPSFANASRMSASRSSSRETSGGVVIFFSGLLPHVEIGHMRISSAGKGRITSRGSGSSLSQWAQSPGARITGIRSANMASKRAFRIGRSRTGLGLFATTPIKKKAFIVEYKGRKLTTKQADKLEARGNRYLCEINSRWTIDGTSRKNLARYANHSCRPNAEAHTIGHKVIIRAIKNIGTGAEITYNYGRDYLINVITRRGCQCDKCRKRRADVRAKARAKSRRAPRSRRRKGKKKCG